MFRVTSLCSRQGVATAVALVAISAMPLQAAAAIITVGSNAKFQCDYTDIQTAINAAPTHSEIHVTTGSYTAQHIGFSNKILSIYGYSSCDRAATPSNVTIDGFGHTGDSVITLKGKADLTLRNITIQNGKEGLANHGGGIFFDGQGGLHLSNVGVLNNSAGYGAGIYMKGENTTPSGLDIGDNVTISHNSANISGGGLYLEGAVTMTMSGLNSTIYANTASGVYDKIGQLDPQYGNQNGAGGGIAAIAPADLYIGTSGVPFFDLGVVDSNHAVNGGGVALFGIDCGLDLGFTLYSRDPAHPTAINSNTASNHGGGFYLHPKAPGTTAFCPTSPSVFLYDFQLAYNTAADGAAMYLDEDTAIFGTQDQGVEVALNQLTEFGSTNIYPASLGAVPCVASATCNSIDHNVTQSGTGAKAVPTAGAIFYVSTSSGIYANRVQVQDNTAGNIVYIKGDNDESQPDQFFNSLFAFNRLTGELIRQDGDDAHVTLDSVTITRDTIPKNYPILRVNSGLTIANSILTEAANNPALAYTGSAGNLYVNWVMASNPANLLLNHSATVFTQDPQFYNPVSGDFRLATTSPYIDFSNNDAALPTDLDGNPRIVDYLNKPNGTGTRDLGAYELQNSINVAAAANFAVATASSTLSTFNLPSAAIDGDHTGVPTATSNSFWADLTPGVFPDMLMVTFSTPRRINTVTVYSLQDTWPMGVEPSDTMTFSQYGLVDFDIQVPDPISGGWVTVQSITGNNLVKRVVALPSSITPASAVRIVCNNGETGFSRIVELEVLGY